MAKGKPAANLTTSIKYDSKKFGKKAKMKFNLLTKKEIKTAKKPVNIISGTNGNVKMFTRGATIEVSPVILIKSGKTETWVEIVAINVSLIELFEINFVFFSIKFPIFIRPKVAKKDN